MVAVHPGVQFGGRVVHHDDGVGRSGGLCHADSPWQRNRDRFRVA
ncbi:Uncharacterised protein [Bordetella pertussis]|nr:Uncharacterised protein [Bordetella pertussis]